MEDMTMNIFEKDYGTCRVCKKQSEDRKLVKYGVRHYAHPACFLTKFGSDGFKKLALTPLEQFPVMVADGFGVLPELKERLSYLKKYYRVKA
jgi:hypothetical protein